MWILKELIEILRLNISFLSLEFPSREFMRGHDAYRGKKAFQRPSRNAAFERRLVVVWDERTSFISNLLRRLYQPFVLRSLVC